ncbi:hypothetical protein [Amycolatopsis sp. NPDC052450]|uniref:hypothetical protein n=1 Tax=Amycolatopsis sp. NPDC052450 TaxID=3363937 RepID=UPI0037CB53D3
MVISIAVKKGIIPDDYKHTIPLKNITGVQHTKPTVFSPGKVVIKHNGASADAVVNVPMFADKLNKDTFLYSAGELKKVTEIIDAINKARSK